METPVLLNGQMPQLGHIQMHRDPHTVQTKRQSWVCECESARKVVRLLQMHTQQGSPVASV